MSNNTPEVTQTPDPSDVIASREQIGELHKLAKSTEALGQVVNQTNIGEFLGGSKGGEKAVETAITGQLPK